MNIPKINAKRLAVVLGALALAGGAAAVMAPAASASAPPAAHGGPAATQSKVGFSSGFHIYNYTSAPITLAYITGDGNFEGRPPDGAVLNPGSYQDIEVQYKFADPQEDMPVYATPNGHVNAVLDINGLGDPSVERCSVDAGVCTTDGITNVYFLDSPGTVNNLGPDQKQAQADALNQLCNAGAASCQFTPTARAHILSDPRPFGEAVENPCDYDESFTVESEDDVSESDSVGVELTVGVGIEEIVSAEITAKYEHEWTREHKFAQTEELKVKPHTTAWYTHEAPTIRDTGNFTVTLGNTTWNLTGVYFDTPDLTDEAQLGKYIPVEQNGATGTCPNPNAPANS